MGRVLMLILVLSMLLSIPAYADNGTTSIQDEEPVQGIDYVYFQGTSGTWYYVYFARDYVGDAYSAYSDVNGVCQAFINGTLIRYGYLFDVSVTTIEVDKYWGPKTKAALMLAQQYAGAGTPDGICGPVTWRRMYVYSGCTTGGYLGSGIISLIKNYL